MPEEADPDHHSKSFGSENFCGSIHDAVVGMVIVRAWDDLASDRFL